MTPWHLGPKYPGSPAYMSIYIMGFFLGVLHHQRRKQVGECWVVILFSMKEQPTN
jgi:hypothetical protein